MGVAQNSTQSDRRTLASGSFRRRLPYLLAVLVPLAGGMLSRLTDNEARGAETGRKPNIVIFFADDLGYSDLGCYGGEIETPHLDRLASQGLKFTQFYNTARCWPSRAALLTGYYAQQVRRDAFPAGPGGSRGVRPAWAPLLPALLKPHGYSSYHSGKWHVDGERLTAGFLRSYSLEDHNRFFTPQDHFEDDRPLPPVAPDHGYYATTGIADHAIRCLKEHAISRAGQPFFSYVAFTAPHFPLQALPQDIEKYLARYSDGWEVARARRFERQKELGFAFQELSAVEREQGPPYPFPDALEKLGPGETNRPQLWTELTPEQQAFQARKMAIHAAMVDRMDQEIGRILAQVDAMGQRENTLIMFLSDNGASAEIMVRGDGHNRDAEPGSAETYLSLGPGWSTVANTPFRRHKTWVHEGGISTPFVVSWPQGIAARGELRGSAAHLIDIVPTLLAVNGEESASGPTSVGGPARPGLSLLPEFARNGSIQHDELWWLHEKNRAFRQGDWKLVASGSTAPWELYDLKTDRAEQHNLAAQHPEKVRELAALWEQRTAEYRLQAEGDLDPGRPEPRPRGKGKVPRTN